MGNKSASSPAQAAAPQRAGEGAGGTGWRPSWKPHEHRPRSWARTPEHEGRSELWDWRQGHPLTAYVQRSWNSGELPALVMVTEALTTRRCSPRTGQHAVRGPLSRGKRSRHAPPAGSAGSSSPGGAPTPSPCRTATRPTFLPAFGGDKGGSCRGQRPHSGRLARIFHAVDHVFRQLWEGLRGTVK